MMNETEKNPSVNGDSTGKLISRINAKIMKMRQKEPNFG